ncbi:MAG: hypothetical protein R3F55_07705 [Alphaproteobacteria bacterium]
MTRIHAAKSVLFAMTAGIALSAGVANAQDAFISCNERHWDQFGNAMSSNDSQVLWQFVQDLGTDCPPLLQTAQVVLCEMDPAACLVAIEPAAGEPTETIPENDEPIEESDEPYDFSYRDPGEHIGWENDRTDNSSPADSGNDNPGGNEDTGGNDDTSDRGDDKPTETCCSISEAAVL